MGNCPGAYSSKNLLVLPFNENLSNITGFLRNLNTNVAFRNDNVLKNRLIKNSPVNSAGCVYHIQCK